MSQVLTVPPPPGSPIPRILPPGPAKLAPGITRPRQAAVGPTVEEGTTPVDQIGFDGVTAYPEAALRPLTAGLLGPAVSREGIEEARLAILDLYRRDGAVFTAVTARLAGRRLTFVVTEGYVVDVDVQGDIGPARAQVLSFLQHLTQERPLRAASLERWMLLVSDIPGVTAHAVLRPSSGEPGALTLVVEVSRKVLSGLVLADNRAYQYTGPNEGLLSVDVNSVTALGERTTLSLFHSFDQTQIFGQATTEMFLGASGLRLRVYGGAGDIVPTGPLQSTGYFGFTTVFGGQLSYPLVRQRQQTLNLVASFDAIESSVDQDLGANGSAQRTSFDSLRVMRAGADYAWLDVWAGDERSATNSATVRVSQGLPALGASENGSADAGRVGERTDFTKANFELSRTQTLFSPSPETTVSVRLAAAGQFSRNVLPPVEKFFLGGSRFDRGYYAGQVTGDSALTTTIEVQLDTPIRLPDGWRLAPTAQFYGFYDWGQTWESRRTDADHTLRSVGFGVRFYPTGTQQYEIDLEAVTRLSPYPNGTGSNVSALKGEALYWQALARF
jgi:hemolysin activation/secretion protein